MPGDEEAKFRGKVVECLKGDVFVEFISSMTRAGIPDLHMIWQPEGTAVWAELKAISAPEKRTARTKRASSYGFTGLQRSWLERTVEAGGLGFGLVGVRNEKNRWEAVVIPALELPRGALNWSDLDGRPRLILTRGLYQDLRAQVLGT